ncbi:TetR/AcrR family transcriptional regulator [Kribbella monticola]|uniref:TetR/AcrR family transcriptional regulator n=1 Tax=Kribbella monticola TaxID=2185285 RepID=UPI000DD4A3F9|nr:TetR/AcrR family transcriptional regulator [Kribbella monticola]
MATGLRERWRVKARRTIQECALDLFDERGFGAVTIEEIAAAAEVSPSSVYRYFGTKEGILVADEFDTMSEEALAEILDVDDPVESMLQIVLRYEAVAADDATPAAEGALRGERSPWRRVRYFFQEPSVRMAACAALDRAGQRIAPLLAGGGRGLTEAQARVAANALVFGYFAALEQWYLEGGNQPIAGYVEEGMSPLRAIWSDAKRS